MQVQSVKCYHEIKCCHGNKLSGVQVGYKIENDQTMSFEGKMKAWGISLFCCDITVGQQRGEKHINFTWFLWGE